MDDEKSKMEALIEEIASKNETDDFWAITSQMHLLKG